MNLSVLLSMCIAFLFSESNVELSAAAPISGETLSHMDGINWKYVFGPILIFGETIQVWMLRALVTGSIILGTFALADYDGRGIDWHEIYWVPASIMISSYALVVLGLVLTPIIWLYRMLDEILWRQIIQRRISRFFRKLLRRKRCYNVQ